MKTYLTICSLQAQMCGFNSFVLKVWPQYSRVVEIISACDGGMHSACRGCGLNSPAVSNEPCACDWGIALGVGWRVCPPAPCLLGWSGAPWGHRLVPPLGLWVCVSVRGPCGSLGDASWGARVPGWGAWPAWPCWVIVAALGFGVHRTCMFVQGLPAPVESHC